MYRLTSGMPVSLLTKEVKGTHTTLMVLRVRRWSWTRWLESTRSTEWTWCM